MNCINSFDNVIVVDENDNELGMCEKLQAHKNPVLHRAFSIFIFNSEGKLLLQRRNKEKYHSAGLWTNTCCSHPQKNRSLLYSASIRLVQEMGIMCPLRPLFSFCYKTKLGDLYEYEYDHVLIGFTDAVPHINEAEVCEYRWESLDNLKKQIKNDNELFTYWFKYIIENYSSLLQNEIDRNSEIIYNEELYHKQIKFQKEISNIINKELSIDNNLPKDLVESIKTSMYINGKCKRSQMMYLCSKLINDVDEKDLAYVAASIELMQNASLIHDDVIDNGETRRGKDTLNKKYGSNVAIINGDFVIFNAYNLLLRLAINNEKKITKIMNILNDAYIDMCLGLRMEEKIIGNFSFNENYYMKLIERKTASFFSSVCSVGAVLANATDDTIQLLQKYGYFFGLAYQIKDDLLPYINKHNGTNKDIDADLKNKMITLPYFYSYHELSERNQIIMKKYFEENQNIDLKQIYDMVNSTSSVSKCLLLVIDCVYSALNILENFEDSNAKRELIRLTLKLLK